jgi:hypothetical protein
MKQRISKKRIYELFYEIERKSKFFSKAMPVDILPLYDLKGSISGYFIVNRKTGEMTSHSSNREVYDILINYFKPLLKRYIRVHRKEA